MLGIATVVGAAIAAMLCRLGHDLGAKRDHMANALRVMGGTLLFAMAASVAGDGLWLGVISATLAGVFVAVGGIDILRNEMRPAVARLVAVPDAVDAPVAARDGDTMEMPVVVRDVA